MVLSLITIVIGVGFLVKGADWLVDGGAGIALKSGVSHLVVGLTVVAFGTSAPELTASLVAALKGSGDICFGNIVGSNVANIALILGMTALLRPVVVNRALVRWEIPFMIAISALIWYIGFFNKAERIYGIVLLALFVWYVIHCIQSPPAPVGVDDEKAMRSYTFLSFLVLLGIGGLVIGGRLFVDGAQNISRELGVSEAVIGLTVVSVGTSLPELATSVVAALKGHSDISLGNIIGSNIFNILLVIGTTSTLLPFTISRDRFLTVVGLPFMMGLSVILWPISYSGTRINRIEGGFFFAVFCMYTVLALVMSTH